MSELCQLMHSYSSAGAKDHRVNIRGHVVEAYRSGTTAEAGSPHGTATSLRRAPGAGAIAALTAAAYFLVFADHIDGAAIGPRAAFLIVAPVLLAPILLSSRMPSRDVGDSFSDWLSAAFVAVAGFSTIHVAGNHLPELTAPWALPLLGIVVWSVCSTTVLFGAYEATVLWPLWLLAVGCAAPTPLLAWLNAGGSPLGAVALAGVVAAIGVIASARRVPVGLRTPLAVCGATVAAAIALTLGGRTGLSIEMSTLGAVAPAAAVIAVWIGTRRARAFATVDGRVVHV